MVLTGTVNNATRFVDGTSGNIYVTDPTAGTPKVHVVASSGAVIYSFGVNGTVPNSGQFQTPLGVTIVDKDIYVVDNAADSVVRFRSGGW